MVARVMFQWNCHGVRVRLTNRTSGQGWSCYTNAGSTARYWHVSMTTAAAVLTLSPHEAKKWLHLPLKFPWGRNTAGLSFIPVKTKYFWLWNFRRQKLTNNVVTGSSGSGDACCGSSEVRELRYNLLPNKWLIYTRVRKNVHLFIFQITLLKNKWFQWFCVC